MEINKCRICGKPIDPGRIYCSMDCVGDGMINGMKYPKQRKEYMADYYLRYQEMMLDQNLL